MTKSKIRSFWMVASFFLLATLIFSPTAIVSADEGDGEAKTEQRMKRIKHPRFGEVTEINTEDNTMVLKVVHPKMRDAAEKYVLVNYSDDTIIKQDREDATEADIEIGEKVAVRGERSESEEYFSQIEAKKIHVFDELQPKRYSKHKARKTKQE